MKKVALACTGGGTKASVNIGVLRALKELNIEIEAISGASMGAVVAFLYICDYSTEDILKVLENEAYRDKKFTLLEKLICIPRLFIMGGAKKAKHIIKYIEKIEEERKIKSMDSINIPFIVPALDLSSRETVYYSSKKVEESVICYCDRKVSEAIKSSGSLPLLYNPNKVVINGENHYMLDGGILTNTLITPLRKYSNFVIGVSNKFYPKKRKRINLFTGFTQTFQAIRRSWLRNEKEKADLWIECDLETNDFSGKREMMKHYEQIGYETTMKIFKEKGIEKVLDEGINYV